MSQQTVFRSGAAVVTVLPSKWRKEHGIEAGSTIKLYETEDGKLVISAEGR